MIVVLGKAELLFAIFCINLLTVIVFFIALIVALAIYCVIKDFINKRTK